MTKTSVDKNLERKLRRALHKHGYSMHKLHPNRHYQGINLGGYMIVNDSVNAVVAGSYYDCGLEDIAEIVNALEAHE